MTRLAAEYALPVKREELAVRFEFLRQRYAPTLVAADGVGEESLARVQV